MPNISLYDLITPDLEQDVSVSTVDMMLKISYQIEDIVIDNELPVDFYAGFQRFSYFRHQDKRYERLASVARRVYVFGEPDVTPPTIPGVQFIPLAPDDPLTKEWFLVVNTPSFFTALLTQEVPGADLIRGDRRFQGIWTYDEQLVSNAYLLLAQVLHQPYRPVTQRDYRSQNRYLVRMSNKLVHYSETASLNLAQSESTVSILSQVAQEMSSATGLDEGLTAIAGALQTTLQSRTARIYLTEPDNSGLRLAAAAGGSGIVPPRHVAPGQGIVGEAAAERRALVIPDTAEAGDHDPLDPAVRSLAAAPLLAGDRLLGVLVLGREQPGAFDDLALRLLQAVAAQVSLAVERSEHINARERLERMFQIVLASASEGLITTDPHGLITAINQAAGAALGIDEAQYLRKPLTALSNDNLNALAQEAQARQSDSYREIPLPNGQTVLAGAALVRDTDGSPLGWVIALRDIAAPLPAASMEPAPLATLAALELPAPGNELVPNRDLDNRLRQISGLTALLPTRIPLNEEQTRFVGQIIKLTRETARLVNNLVYLNQLEDGDSGERADTALEPLLAELVERYQPAATRRGVSVKLLLEPLPPVAVNAAGVTRAVQNLLENALKYTPAGGTILVGLESRENLVHLTVSDTGIGLWPRDLGLVFKRFYRVINPQNQETPSGGLGLAVVKAVAEAHGGRAWVESTLGQGSIFGLALPMEPSSVESRTPASGVQSKG